MTVASIFRLFPFRFSVRIDSATFGKYSGSFSKSIIDHSNIFNGRFNNTLIVKYDFFRINNCNNKICFDILHSMKLQRLIVIRGNSGSGKSKVAEMLREKIEGKVAIVGLDTLRRTILKESDKFENTDVMDLIKQTVTYCLSKEYTVILEGIFPKQKYQNLIINLLESVSCKTSLYYIDVSLEETIKRHLTKPAPILEEFGEKELKEWYLPQDYLDIKEEIIIDENSTIDETVNLILNS